MRLGVLSFLAGILCLAAGCEKQEAAGSGFSAHGRLKVTVLVQMPNVDLVKETIDGMSATRSYEANITAFNAIKLMAQKALDIGK